MTKMPKRCAFGCERTGLTMHSFPNPEKYPERFNAWVDLIGGKLETPSDYELYKKKMVCDIHFVDRHRNRFKRLNNLSVPTLYLCASTRPALSEITNASAEPSTSAVSDTLRPIPISDTLPVEGTQHIMLHPNSALPDASELPQSSINPNLPVAVTMKVAPQANSDYYQEVTSMRAKILMEHSYTSLSKSQRKPGRKGAALLYKEAQLKPLKAKIKYLQSLVCRLRQKNLSFKERILNAEKLNKNEAFQRVVKNMTEPAKLFVHMQQQATKKPKGRRFSLEEKILSLSLFKKSPRCYKLLNRYFSLPSSRAMKRLLSQVQLHPGINEIIFEKIKNNVAGKEEADRLCSLIFDEMAITPQIFFNTKKDRFEGFANNKENDFADHALVFMVKGVKCNFKQPVAYYFTNSLNKIDLKLWIKTVIEKIHECGLIVVNTVCDQSTINVGAITELVKETKGIYIRKNKEWREDFFLVKGKKIIPIYDAPHLFKGLRNNLLTKDLLYTINGIEKMVKWQHYQMVYRADKCYGELRLLHKITEEHVIPEKIRKMRVKTATQVFSHSMAVVAEHLTARGDLPQECRNLVDITLLFDNLFDTLNVSTMFIPNGKIYKGPVKRNSPHHQLLQNAKQIIKTFKYVKCIKTGDKIRLVNTVVPTVGNLIKTIEGMERLWKLLSGKYGLDIMLSRNFNQDPAENFFGNIRSYGARNNAPNTMAFESAFKALLLNNYNTPHSNRANCEEDSNECLQTLDFFLKESIKVPDVVEEKNIHFNNEILLSPNQNDNDAGQANYVCGWVLKKCLSNIVKGCKRCKTDLLDNSSRNENNSFIYAKEYLNKKWLCYPSKATELFFKDIQNVIVSFLKKNLPKKNVAKTIASFIELVVDCHFKCERHKIDLKKYFVNMTINILSYSWSRSVNRILSGKIGYDGEDETKVAAQIYFEKRKKYKNKK